MITKTKQSLTFFTVIIFLIFNGVFLTKGLAQKTVIDSLLHEYEKAMADSQKVNLLENLIEETYFTNPEKAMDYAKQQQDLIKEDEYEKRILNYNTLGVLSYDLGHFAQAIQYFQKEVDLIAQHGSQTFSIYEEHSNFAACYIELGDKKMALEYLFKGLEAAEEHDILPLKRHVFNQISDIYADTKEYEKALAYQKKSLSLTKAMKDQELICFDEITLGRLYVKMDSLENAFLHLKEGVRIAKENNFERYLAKGYNAFSFFYAKKKDFKKGIAYAKQFLAIVERQNDFLSIATAHLNLSRQYLNNQQNKKAIIHLNQAIQIATEHPDPVVVLSAKQELNKAYINEKRYKESSILSQEIRVLIDSSMTYKYQEKLARMEVLHDVKGKEKELLIKELTIKEKEGVIKQKNIIQAGLIGFLLLFMIMLYGAYYAYQQKTKLNLKLKKLNQINQLQSGELRVANTNLKDFSKTISHDILSHVDLIISLTNFEHKTPAETKTVLQKTQQTAQKLKRFSKGLILLSKIEDEDQPLQEVHLNTIVKEVIASFQSEIEESGAIINLGNLPTIPAHEPQMIQLFQNLIGNAMRYKNPNRNLIVDISLEEKENDYLFEVSDNGMGIAAENVPQVFQSFFQVERKGIGSGLGLSICKRIVEYYGGDIWLESQLEKGTSVFFTCPR